MSSPQQEKSSMSDFEILKQLGKGAFGSVYLVKRKADNNIYALKSVIMDKLKKKEQENSLNEVRILASIRHPNIIGYKEAFWDENSQSINIVMEYANEGDLQHKIEQYKKENRFFEENIIWSYSIQMVEGLKALHDEKIMHRDLKSANVFLFNNKICKLGDLNVSKVVKNKMLYTQTGTPYYASPEVWKDKPYSYKSDLWSIGCVIYELCNFRPPFKGRNMDELFNKVCKGETERINKIYSDDLWEMIKMLLRVDPNKRLSCEQFLNCKLVKKKMMEIDGEFDRNPNFNGSNNVLLNSIKINNIREISKKLPKMKNYSNGDSMQNYFNEDDKGSFRGNNSQNTSENNENVLNMNSEVKKRPQTGKNIRKNYILEEPKNKNKINIKIVKNNINNNNYNNIQQNNNNNQNNSNHNDQNYNNHNNQNYNNHNNKNNNHNKQNNNHNNQNNNIKNNQNNNIKNNQNNIKHNNANNNNNKNNQMTKGSGSHKNIRKKENNSNNERKERARTPLINHNKYNIDNKMIKKPIHINIPNNNNKYERHTTDENKNRRREIEQNSKRVLNTEKKIPTKKQNIRPLSSNITNNRKVIKPMNINKDKGKKTQNVKIQRPLSSNPNIQKKYNTNIEHQKRIINHNYPISNNNKIKKRPLSSNPISSNNKNMHLKNNNNKKDNYNSRDNKILNDPDVRMMMGPYKVRENNKMKGNFNMNSAIISNNQNGFLKRNIHPVNVININNNVDNNTNNIIINNPKMQQPIINNYYSINTNNQSNAPVKVINVYNQN